MHWLARSFVPSLGIVSSGDAGLILRVCLHASRKITSRESFLLVPTVSLTSPMLAAVHAI